VIAVEETTVKGCVMTSSVVSVREDADFKEMVTVMRGSRVSAFPVIDASGRVIGVESEADLVMKEAARALPRGAIRLAWWLKDRSRAGGATAAEVMTKPAVTIHEDASVAEAARLMQSRKVKWLPVQHRADALSLVGTVRYLEGVVGIQDRLSYPSQS
jgi:CBS domain-containing protein